MGLTESSAPAAEPVTLEEMKAHLRVTDTASDSYISSLITAARQWAEHYTGVRFVQRSFVWTLDEFPADSRTALIFPVAPVDSVTSVTYLDTNGDSQTWSALLYRLSKDDHFPRLLPAYGESWPSARDISDAVTVTFVAGYDPDSNSPVDHAANVPAPVKHAIKLLCGHWYENRMESVRDALSDIPYGAKALLSPLKIRVF